MARGRLVIEFDVMNIVEFNTYRDHFYELFVDYFTDEKLEPEETLRNAKFSEELV